MIIDVLLIFLLGYFECIISTKYINEWHGQVGYIRPSPPASSHNIQAVAETASSKRSVIKVSHLQSRASRYFLV